MRGTKNEHTMVSNNNKRNYIEDITIVLKFSNIKIFANACRYGNIIHQKYLDKTF